MIKSITFDRGMEFASHKTLGIDTYFCNPGSPWGKGSMENTNGRIRQLMPKSKTPLFIKQELMNANLRRLPRQELR